MRVHLPFQDASSFVNEGKVAKPFPITLQTALLNEAKPSNASMTGAHQLGKLNAAMAVRFGIGHWNVTDNKPVLTQYKAIEHFLETRDAYDKELLEYVLKAAIYAAARRNFKADRPKDKVIVELRDLIEGLIQLAYYSGDAMEQMEGMAAMGGDKIVSANEFHIRSDFGLRATIKPHKVRGALDALFPEGKGRDYNYRELELFLSDLRRHWASQEIGSHEEGESQSESNYIDSEEFEKFIEGITESVKSGKEIDAEAHSLALNPEPAKMEFAASTRRFLTAFLYKYKDRPTNIRLTTMVAYLMELDKQLQYDQGNGSVADDIKDVALDLSEVRHHVHAEAKKQDSKLFRTINTRSPQWFRLRDTVLYDESIPKEQRKITEEQHNMALGLIQEVENAGNPMLVSSTLHRLDVFYNQLPWEPVRLKEPSETEMLAAFNEKFANMERVAEQIVNAILSDRLARRSIAEGKLTPKDYKPLIFVFDGVAGVGKTEFAKTIGQFTGRMFEEIYLGGETDPRHLTGHDSVYMGSKPGQILDAFIRAKATNPVILLDEADKMGRSHQGNPESVLLRVLDKENNKRYKDDFLGIPYDISGALFVLTTNQFQQLSDPVKSRLTPVVIRGVPPQEKGNVTLAKILPKIRREFGIAKEQLGLEKEVFDLDPQTLEWIRENYAPSVGLRDMEDLLRSLATRVAAKFEQWKPGERLPEDLPVFTPDNIPKLLNRAPDARLNKLKAIPRVGYTQVMVVGGSHGRGGGCSDFGVKLRVQSVGKGREAGLYLGNTPVLHKEMSQDAERNTLIYFVANARKFGLEELLRDYRVEVNFHDGRISGPVDGPSAGLAKVLTTYSALTLKEIPGDLAVTGAFNASTGEVTRIGGLREKIAFSIERGAKTILYPKENQPDFDLMEDAIKRAPGVKFYPIDTFEEAAQILWPQENGLTLVDKDKLIEHYLGTPS